MHVRHLAECLAQLEASINARLATAIKMPPLLLLFQDTTAPARHDSLLHSACPASALMRNVWAPRRITRIIFSTMTVSPALQPRVLCQYKAFMEETQQEHNRFVPLKKKKNPTAALWQRSQTLTCINQSEQTRAKKLPEPTIQANLSRLGYRTLEIYLGVSDRKTYLGSATWEKSHNSLLTLQHLSYDCPTLWSL